MSWKIRLHYPPIGFGEFIEVYARRPRWNDFGYNYHATFIFKYGGESVKLSAFLLPCAGKQGEYSDNLPDFPNGEIFNFETLLSEPEQYRLIGDRLPIEDLNYILEALHDVSYRYTAGSHNYDTLIRSAQFRLGVLRYENAYLSLINGYPSAYVKSPTHDAKFPFKFSAILPGSENSVILNIEYRQHRFFDDRVHCLVGVNGTGKTNLLARLVAATCMSCNEVHGAPATELYTGRHQSLAFDAGSLEMPEGSGFNRVVSYFSDPASALPRGNSVGRFEYHAFNTTARSETQGFNNNLTYLLANLLRIENENFDDPKNVILADVLKGILPMELLAIPVTGECPQGHYVFDAEGERWSYISHMTSEQRSLEILGTIDTNREPGFLAYGSRTVIALSSGQRSIFNFALHFLCLAGYGTLLLIDEPETYLHPNLVSDYMMFLYKILERTSSVAIIATHSAYVVREVPTHCVHILQREGSRSSINNPYLRTLGASVTDISLAVFGDSTVDAYHRKVSEIVAKTEMPFDKIVEAYKDIFNIEMLMEIKDRISRPDEYH
ncbi:AAA family ATPase [Pseudomonas asiatica]|uniref:AAA family ATPase n=1 Tax=Pseudomonas asiatica TaxID=2219225 RepID=UPI00383A55E4